MELFRAAWLGRLAPARYVSPPLSRRPCLALSRAVSRAVSRAISRAVSRTRISRLSRDFVSRPCLANSCHATLYLDAVHAAPTEWSQRHPSAALWVDLRQLCTHPCSSVLIRTHPCSSGTKSAAGPRLSRRFDPQKCQVLIVPRGQTGGAWKYGLTRAMMSCGVSKSAYLRTRTRRQDSRASRSSFSMSRSYCRLSVRC